MGALATPEVISRPGIYATIQASSAAQEAVLALEPLQITLEDMQLDAGLVQPLAVDLRLAGEWPRAPMAPGHVKDLCRSRASGLHWACSGGSG